MKPNRNLNNPLTCWSKFHAEDLLDDDKLPCRRTKIIPSQFPFIYHSGSGNWRPDLCLKQLEIRVRGKCSLKNYFFYVCPWEFVEIRKGYIGS